jgi:uncharacterized protein YndB with AHSA1/START domain
METLVMEHAQTEIADSPKLSITQFIRAPRARVYEAWTRPEALQTWFSDGANVCAAAELDVREGGAFTLLIQIGSAHATSDSHTEDTDVKRTVTIRGVYRTVVPNALLQFSWRGCTPDETSLVTVSLKDAAGDTELTLTHEQFATEASRDGHNQGWTAIVANLAKMLSN